MVLLSPTKWRGDVCSLSSVQMQRKSGLWGPVGVWRKVTGASRLAMCWGTTACSRLLAAYKLKYSVMYDNQDTQTRLEIQTSCIFVSGLLVSIQTLQSSEGVQYYNPSVLQGYLPYSLHLISLARSVFHWLMHLHTNYKHTDTCLTMFPGQLHHQEPINPNGQISSSVLVRAAWELYFLLGLLFGSH